MNFISKASAQPLTGLAFTKTFDYNRKEAFIRRNSMLFTATDKKCCLYIIKLLTANKQKRLACREIELKNYHAILNKLTGIANGYHKKHDIIDIDYR